MSTHASMPSDVEPISLDDLIADSRALQHLLDPHPAAATRPPQQRALRTPLRIPEPALALVAGLDSYGD